MKKASFYILSALTLMFIGLKLAGKIDWGWQWVFSPVWIPVVVYVLVFIGSTCFVIYRYRHNENFRKAMDDYKKTKQQSKRTLADRLKEIREEQEKFERRKK